MKNVIIMDISRISNNVWNDRKNKKLEHFEIAHIHAQVLPLRAIEMSDVVIVMDKWDFKTLKCRIPDIPTQVLSLQYLDLTLELITKWQRS